MGLKMPRLQTNTAQENPIGASSSCHHCHQLHRRCHHSHLKRDECSHTITGTQGTSPCCCPGRWLVRPSTPTHPSPPPALVVATKCHKPAAQKNPKPPKKHLCLQSANTYNKKQNKNKNNTTTAPPSLPPWPTAQRSSRTTETDQMTATRASPSR